MCGGKRTQSMRASEYLSNVDTRTPGGVPRCSGRLPMEMGAEGLEEMIDLGKRNCI